MPNLVVPSRLRAGDTVAVIAPSRSMAIIGDEVRAVAAARFAELGLELRFGRHVEVIDDFASSSVDQRAADLHDAFADPTINGVITVIGGYNSNQLLPFIDWDLIAANPKVFCGYSDITALSCAIWARTGLITFSGPHFSSFGMIEHFDQTLDWFTEAMVGPGPTSGVISIEPAATWSDDPWYAHQHDRNIEPNDGYWVMAEGAAEGHLIGGNLCTLNLLQGTDYMPDLAGAVVFVEDDFESSIVAFDRDLTSLSQQPGFADVRGLLIGRFQRQTAMTRELLGAVVANNHRLRDIPIVANVDFGHTDPLCTLPVGGDARLAAQADSVELTIQWGETPGQP